MYNAKLPPGFPTLWKLFAFTLLLAATTRTDAQSAAESKPHAVMSDYAWTEKGDLLLATRLNSSAKAPLLLGEMEGEGPSIPFSLSACTLVDMQTGKRLSPLPKLPSRPFWGPKSVAMVLKPSSWIQLAVAFPKPPKPPVDANGKHVDYLLRLEFPAIFPPLDIRIPYSEPSAKTTE